MSVGIDAIPDSVVDNFESVDSDPAGVYDDGEGLSDYYKGATAAYERTTDNVPVGDHALRATDTDATDLILLSEPGNGLNRYPEKGDTVKALVRGEDDLRQGILTNGDYDAEEDEASGYFVHPYFRSDSELTIAKMVDQDPNNADRTEIESTSVTLNEGNYYWVEFDTPDDDGNMEARIFEWDDPGRGDLEATVTTTDTDIDPDNRGVGVVHIDGRDGPGTVVDEIEIVD